LRSRRWKLALAVGLILTAILIKQNVFPPTISQLRNPSVILQTTAASPDTLITSEAQDTSVSVPKTGTAILFPATATLSPAASATVTPVIYVVKSGDIPLSIADVFGISVEALLATNQITDPTTLQIGQQLLIPVTLTPDPEDLSANTGILAEASTSTPSRVTYTVQKGDTLSSIAAVYGTNIETLAIANDIQDSASLRVGEQLLIFPDHSLPSGIETIRHEIEDGDTLLGLATRYGSTANDILAANPDLEPTRLRVGQEIVIPLTQTKSNTASNPTRPRITSPETTTSALATREQEMTEVINAERRAQGLPPLSVDEPLTAVARAHAQDMVVRGYFAHVTPEGITLPDRLKDQGLGFNWVGENIQRNTQPIDKTVQYAADWFMNSEPHRNNILNDRFKRIGVGVAEGPPGWYTFVLVFASES
jgi:uncharacterized protein YkwD